MSLFYKCYLPSFEQLLFSNVHYKDQTAKILRRSYKHELT